MKIVKNDLFDYPNRFIYQLENGFKFSLDSILLAEFTSVSKKAKVLDMCTGNAPVPLILSLKQNCDIVGFEIQKDIANLANLSVEVNNLQDKIKIINDDIKNLDKYYPKGFFDVITCNPPYFKYNESNYVNKSDYLKLARHEIAIDLPNIFEIASKYLRSNGAFFLIHRVNRLDDIIYLARLNNINVKEIQLIITRNGETPNTVLVKCVKNSKNGVVLRKIVCVDKLGTYQHLFEKR